VTIAISEKGTQGYCCMVAAAKWYSAGNADSSAELLFLSSIPLQVPRQLGGDEREGPRLRFRGRCIVFLAHGLKASSLDAQ
jgi:hypothetical protein